MGHAEGKWINVMFVQLQYVRFENKYRMYICMYMYICI